MEMLLAAISYEPVQRWGPVSPHGVGTAAGFLLGAMLMTKRAEARGIPREESHNAVFAGAVGAIIGARGFYVLGHLEDFPSAADMLAVWQGGLTMFGGFIGGLVLGLGYMKFKGISIAHTLEAAAPGFVVGVICGRIGDLIIADHLGDPTDFVLGYRIPESANLAPGYGPPTYVPGAVVHQTALYDLAGAIVLLGFLWWFGKRVHRPGTLFAVFSLWYGVQRFLIDFTRNRDIIDSSFYGLSGSQWAGLAFAVGGAAGLAWLTRKGYEEPVLDAVPAGAGPAAGAVANAGQEPVAAEPVGAQTGSAQPVAAEPVVAQSGVTEQGVAEHGVAEPGVADPAVPEPVVAEPVAEDPVAPPPASPPEDMPLSTPAAVDGAVEEPEPPSSSRDVGSAGEPDAPSAVEEGPSPDVPVVAEPEEPAEASAAEPGQPQPDEEPPA